jgi:polysaccharide deacetylase 2 family uncharacterized protein YibQ
LRRCHIPRRQPAEAFFRHGENAAVEHKTRKRRLAALGLAAVAVAAMILFSAPSLRSGLFCKFTKNRTPSSPAARGPAPAQTASAKIAGIESAIAARLAQLEARPSDISSHFSENDRTLTVSALLPRGRPFEWVVWQLSGSAEGTPYVMTDCTFDEKKQSAALVFTSPRKKDPRVVCTVSFSERYQSATAQMAFVIERLEDSATAYQLGVEILSLAEPLSVSIVPAGKKASLIAQLAEQNHKEVIVLLPLEPAGRIPAPLEPFTIMVHYPEETVEKLMTNAIKVIPGFAGFSNLWGSRALEDSRIMNIVLDKIKKQHGYFIENRTARNSVAPSIAAALKLPYGLIGGRLDSKVPSELHGRIRHFAASAQVNGKFIVGAAASRQMLIALKSEASWLRQNGIKLVFASEIVKQ